MEAQHVPYQSTAQQVLAAAGGHLHFTFDTPGNARGLVESGKLRPLAVTGPRRTAFMPDVPTFEELGHQGFDLFVWNGLVAPAGTPPEIVALLSQRINEAARRPETVRAYMQIGAEVVASTPEEFSRTILRETEKWGRVIREAGVEQG